MRPDGKTRGGSSRRQRPDCHYGSDQPWKRGALQRVVDLTLAKGAGEILYLDGQGLESSDGVGLETGGDGSFAVYVSSTTPVVRSGSGSSSARSLICAPACRGGCRAKRRAGARSPPKDWRTFQYRLDHPAESSPVARFDARTACPTHRWPQSVLAGPERLGGGAFPGRILVSDHRDHRGERDQRP